MILKEYLKLHYINDKNKKCKKIGKTILGFGLFLPLLFKLQVPAISSSNFVMVVSIATALMCPTAILIFQLRIKELDKQTRLNELDISSVDELFYLTLWIIEIGVLLSFILSTPELFHTEKIKYVNRIQPALCITVLVYFIYLIQEFARRFERAYARIARKQK